MSDEATPFRRENTSYRHYMALQTRANWLRRRADHVAGASFPDPRNIEQQAAGIELTWRARVIGRYTRGIRRHRA